MNVQRWMSAKFFVFFMTWGIFLPYWTGWLINVKHVSIEQASIIMSMGLLMRGLSTLVIFPFASDKLSSRNLLRIMAVGSFIALLSYIPASSFTSLLFVTLLLHLFYPALMPALDSAAGLLAQHKQLPNYGKSRSWGSIGFVIAGMTLTLFTALLGEMAIFWALLFTTLLFMVLLLGPAPTVLTDKPKPEAATAGMKTLLKNKNFLLVLVIVILLQAAHAVYYNYGYIFLQHIGAPASAIGLIINIAVIAEIIFFSVADRFFRHVSIGSLLAVAALGSTVRWVLIFISPTLLVFSIAQTLHALSFAMGHYAFMKFLINELPQDTISKAQGVYSAFALSWSTALLTIFGGYLYKIDPSYAFLGMVSCTIPSMLLALYYRQQAKNLSTN